MEKLYRQGKTYQEIANEFGLIKQTVHARFVRADIQRRPLKHQIISKKRLERLYSDGKLTINEIAFKFKSNSGTIQKALKFHGIPKRPPLKFGCTFADALRELKYDQTINIRIAGKKPRTRLHRSAAAIGIKISVRSIGEDNFKIIRLK